MDAAVLLDLLGNENRRRILRLLSHKPCYVTEISEYLGVSPKAVIDHLRRLEEAGLVESRTDDQRRKYFHISRNLRLEVSVSPYRFGAKSAYPASRSLDMRGRCQHISLKTLEPTSEHPPWDEADEEQERGDDEEGERGGDEERDEVEIGGTPDRSETPESEADSDTPEPSEMPGQGTGTASAAPNGGTETGDVAELARQYAYLEDVESELSLAQRWVHGRVTDVLDDLSERLGSEADSRFYAELLSTLVREPKSARDVANDLNASLDRVESALNRLSERDLVEYDGSGWRIC